MAESKQRRNLIQRIRPFLIAFGVVQATIRVGGRVLAHRLDSGDESSGRIRRVMTMGQVSLRPHSQDFSGAQLDLVMAGANLDLRNARPSPGGIDVTVNCSLAGADIRIPPEWTVSSDVVGLGGVNLRDSGPEAEAPDGASADLRIHLRALLGGVNVRR